MLWSVPKKMFFLTPVLLGHMARLLQNASDSSLELKTGFFSQAVLELAHRCRSSLCTPIEKYN